jgi:UDP-N-acetylglucosamine diphosphorylase / glucose-1-phosphate thymidylyltransferase / UDP-N-acetylgalactosamine diphosphorylase / glucosamine-1-phosphate N-acetyltransferase / galactosamine-1-phosphate N-acetyltransferase
MTMSHPAPDCAPLSLTRSIADFPVANIPLAVRHALACPGAAVLPHAWITEADADAWRESGRKTLADPSGTPLAWTGDAPDAGDVHTASSSFPILHPWDLLRANELAVSLLAGDEIHGEVHPSAVIEGKVRIGHATRVLPGVFIEGNVIIGDHCKIGPNCYLRGNTSIGDHCHIGQSVEIKNCLILPHTNVGHLSYVGDSVLGEHVNLGAGTIVSNLRHDGKNHRSMVAGRLVDSGRRKLGAIIGDGVHTGINTSIYPGRKLWPGTTTRPGEIVQHDIHS